MIQRHCIFPMVCLSSDFEVGRESRNAIHGGADPAPSVVQLQFRYLVEVQEEMWWQIDSCWCALRWWPGRDAPELQRSICWPHFKREREINRFFALSPPFKTPSKTKVFLYFCSKPIILKYFSIFSKNVFSVFCIFSKTTPHMFLSSFDINMIKMFFCFPLCFRGPPKFPAVAGLVGIWGTTVLLSTPAALDNSTPRLFFSFNLDRVGIHVFSSWPAQEKRVDS